MKLHFCGNCGILLSRVSKDATKLDSTMLQDSITTDNPCNNCSSNRSVEGEFTLVDAAIMLQTLYSGIEDTGEDEEPPEEEPEAEET